VIGVLASVLAGWLAGALGNWAADVLPRFSRQRRGDAAEGAPEQVGQPPAAGLAGQPSVPKTAAILHYLTLPWYPFRKGICPHCGARRPLRAPLLELGMIAAYAAGWQRFEGSPAQLATFGLFAWYLLVVLVIDVEHHLVLDVMTVPAAGAALLISFLPGGVSPVSALIGGALGLAVFALIAWIGRGKMGGGDVKLAGVIGLITGYPAVIAALVIGILLGGLAALLLLVTRRAGRKSHMAYAPYLCLGALLAMALAFRVG
jgi:leader peptidase (prepilin peptidase)/N-methyltransferase